MKNKKIMSPYIVMWFRIVFVIWPFALLICSFLFLFMTSSPITESLADRVRSRLIYIFYQWHYTQTHQRLVQWNAANNAQRWIIWSFNDFRIFTIISEFFDLYQFIHQFIISMFWFLESFLIIFFFFFIFFFVSYIFFHL